MSKLDKHTKPTWLNFSVPLPFLPVWSFLASIALGIRILQEEMGATTIWALTVLGCVAMVCETLGTVLTQPVP
ncbi:hypothetical protein ACIG3E_07030 [Streptomyces sp. NPDC053474]|uniref:hypothetical protein n=1 Tax=Streptomyces sp. NPDC053474 TaxID=3365704 RepID=UPI0037CE77BF